MGYYQKKDETNGIDFLKQEIDALEKELAPLRQEGDKKDKLTWQLFELSIWGFALSELIVILGFIIEMASRR